MGSYWRDLIGSVFFPINLDDLKGFWPGTKFWGFLEIKTKQKTSIFVVYLSNKCQKMNEWAPGTTVLLLFWVGITFFCRFGGFGNLAVRHRRDAVGFGFPFCFPILTFFCCFFAPGLHFRLNHKPIDRQHALFDSVISFAIIIGKFC